jgi:hypothetical protein
MTYPHSEIILISLSAITLRRPPRLLRRAFHSLPTEGYHRPSRVTLTLLALPQIGQTSVPMVDSHPPERAAPMLDVMEKQPKFRPFHYRWLPRIV